MQVFAQQLVNGLSVGAVYALIALGYTMVYGILRLINFAHGDVYMVGAVVAWYLADFVTRQTTPSWIIPFGGILGVALAVLLAWWTINFRWRHPTSNMMKWTLLSVAALAGGGVGTLLGQHFFKTAVSENRPPPLWLTLLLIFVGAMLCCGILGYFIEVFAYRPLRNRPRLVSLITAIGVSLLLESLFQVPSVFGATPRQMPPLIPVKTFHLAGAQSSITISNIDIISLSLTVTLMLALTWFVLKTRIGLALRAVSFRFDTASLMGINTNRIISFTFVLGSALAAVAGVIDAMRYDVEPLMGLQQGLKAFVAAVIGGIGSIPGAVVGGLLMGIIDTMLRGYLPSGYTGYSDAAAFFILILVLLVRPSGLFGHCAPEKV